MLNREDGKQKSWKLRLHFPPEALSLSNRRNQKGIEEIIQSGQMGSDTLEQKSRRSGHQKFKIPQQMLTNEVAMEIQ